MTIKISRPFGRTYDNSGEICQHDVCGFSQLSWWRHQMEILSRLLAFCKGNSPVTGDFPAQRPVTRSFDVSFDLHLNQPLSKQLRHRWFEMPSSSLWRHCNVPSDNHCASAYRLLIKNENDLVLQSFRYYYRTQVVCGVILWGLHWNFYITWFIRTRYCI